MNQLGRSVNPIWKPGSLVSILPALTDGVKQLVKPCQGLKVLDIACGSGTCALAFAEEGAKVSAVDLLQEQVEAAKAEAEKRELFSVEFIQADARSLPFENETFDIVTGTGALSNFDEPAPALAEVGRVLKPNGRLALGDFLLPERAQEIWGVLSTFRYGSRRPYLDYWQVQDLLYEAQFEIVQYQPLRWVHAPRIDNWGLSEVLQERYLQAVHDMDLPTKKSLRLQTLKDGRWGVVHDSFVLVATTFETHPRWEIRDLP